MASSLKAARKRMLQQFRSSTRDVGGFVPYAACNVGMLGSSDNPTTRAVSDASVRPAGENVREECGSCSAGRLLSEVTGNGGDAGLT
jgi:hypothetical protein